MRDADHCTIKSKEPTLGFYKIVADATSPKYATPGSACFDIYSLGETWTIPSTEIQAIPTGLIFDIPEGWSVRLHPRSGLSLKGLVLANMEGIIDHDYVDEVKVLVRNVSRYLMTIEPYTRICQAELVPSPQYQLREIPHLPKPKTTRNGGFGSTGLK
jgi:dUTP pyrophosphatase